jgi:outer membrane protein OmpA-like peptidoglycan-associated protein
MKHLPSRLFWTGFVFLAFPATAMTNLFGESGLYRLPSAQVLEPGYLAFSSTVDLHGFDDEYAEDFSNVALVNGVFNLTYGLTQYFECAGSMQIHGDLARGERELSVGDARFAGKLIYPPYPHREQFEMAVNLAIFIPTGSRKSGLFKRKVFFEERYAYTANDAHFEIRFPVMVDFTKTKSGAPFKIHGMFGADLTTSGATHDMFEAGLGLEYLPHPMFSTFFEAFGETQAKKALAPDLDPLWATLGLQINYRFMHFKFGFEYLVSSSKASQIQKINDEYYTTGLYPRTGIFAMFVMSGIVVSQDADKDGFSDPEDKCPKAAEDFDQFQDHDGCPDNDNDKDGIPDKSDKCPMVLEDRDGFQDEDGCPDIDNDKDGVPDSLDKCINTPEDLDGFKDRDGCPEFDNDKDGLPDGKDKCPNDAEDPDGFADDNGCPDLDNDKDGFPDAKDKCPNTPETFNGVDDRDGCPDGRIKLLKTGEKTILPDVRFGKKYNLFAGSYVILNELADYLKFYKEMEIELRVHSDALGSIRQNEKKTQARAEILKNYLVKRGVEAGRLSAKGMGEGSPIAPNETAEGRFRNNRIEIIRTK